MKTPDEIKQGLQHCSEDCCKGCNYEEDCNMADGFSVLACDAFAYIEHLEAGQTACGNWQGQADGYSDGYPVYDVWYCSECGHCIDDGTDDPENLPNYCPNCGAKMDGGA